MSKIQINELNAASIEVLNAQETAEVVGGTFDFFNFKSVVLNQGNLNSTIQNAQSAFSGGNGNSNGTGQGNSANINLFG